ncbi:GntR family transcriptional regulator [Glutamicibacter sp. V16R2B1]|uniref:GntR family transcriptional regulator n=1 Tax=Glutamicibacter sp. V16R2B1 TaxID=2036207 RepID=UPI0010FCE3ED|nr:GntR family transcriptional regulator [Glutamicibacter sp. V16R2B1]MCK9901360.1 GntR family transcriptional regulator [Frankia sp. Cpl3]TLK48003.1 GntR family transcriptional regulator [Glutamicibacter sp. V16R2B1]
MMIDRGGGRHTYQTIAWAIRRGIEGGELRDGDKIPSLPTIQAEYNVSNPTAQAAVRLLKSWQLVRSRPGEGTFVSTIRPVINTMTDMTLPSAEGKRRTWKGIVAEFGREGSQKPTGAGRAEAPIEVADAFGYDADTPIAWRQRHLLIDGLVAQISTSYYAEQVAAAIPELVSPERLRTNSMQMMADVGFVIVPGLGRDVVYGRGATEDEARVFEINIGTPVTEDFRVGRGADGEVLTIETMISNSALLRQAWVF